MHGSRSVTGNFPTVHHGVFTRRAGYSRRRCLIAVSDASVADARRGPTTRSELVSCAACDQAVRPPINCSPAGRFLAPRATDYLLADGEKFHAALARVITPIRGVMICVSAGARRLVQLRHDASSQSGKTTHRHQSSDWSLVVLSESSSIAHPCCPLSQPLQHDRYVVIIITNLLFLVNCIRSHYSDSYSLARRSHK